MGLLFMKLNGLKLPEYVRYNYCAQTSRASEFSRRIVLISDTHISTDDNSSFNTMMFRKGMAEIKKIKNVDYIIHLGDLTHDGTYLEYQIAEDLLRAIPKDNFYIIPGNHDSRNVGYLLYEDIFGPRSFKIDDEELFILGVDSSIPDQNPGHIGKRTIEHVGEQFARNQDKIKVFCFHHQSIPIPLTGRERSAVYDGGDVLEMALSSDVDLILNGHRHVTNIYSCTKGKKDLVLFNSGTFSCNKTRYTEQFSFTVLDINEKMAKFTTKLLMSGEEINRKRYLGRFFSNKCPAERDRIARLIHIGNTHFSSDDYDQEIFNAGTRKINALKPNLVVHTGSLTYNNEPEEYVIAKKEMQKIKCPILMLPGGKDLIKYRWDLYENQMDLLESKFENQHLKVLGINTIDPHIAHGHVGRRKLHNKMKALNNNGNGKVKIIALNHRLIPPPKIRYEKILTDSGAILKDLTDPENAINVVLMGKNNIGFSMQLEECILSYCGSVCSKDVVEFGTHEFNIIDFYSNGFTSVKSYNIESAKTKLIGEFWIKKN